MNRQQEGWFTEYCSVSDKDIALSIKSSKIVHEEVSRYQKITIFDSLNYGRCLALDDSLQCCKWDSFCYQEMITFLALNCHEKPAKVLIIGGGDGGVAGECFKHPSVERVTVCEIDELVVDLSKKYLPHMAKSFEDPRVELIIQDGYSLINTLPSDTFDVIIIDSSDPDQGPAGTLFSKEFYERLIKTLKSDGVVCFQAGNIWFDLEFIRSVMLITGKLFEQVKYASAMTCTYPTGQIGFVVCCKSSKNPVDKPILKLDEEKLSLRYYSSQVHEAAFVLPNFVRDKLKFPAYFELGKDIMIEDPKGCKGDQI